MAYTPPPYDNVEFSLYDGVQSPPLDQVDLIIDQVFGNFGNYVIGSVTIEGQAYAPLVVIGNFLHPIISVQGYATAELPIRTGDGHFEAPAIAFSAMANGTLVKVHNAVNPCYDQYDFNLSSHTASLTWSTTTALPIMPYTEYEIVVTKNKLFAIGGRNESVLGDVKDLVYSVPINSSGDVSGSWTLESNVLTEKKSNCHIFMTSGRVHAIGGTRYASGLYKSTKTCCSAPIDSNGNIGQWTADPDLPFHISMSMPVVSRGRAYLLGGNILNDDGSISENTDKIFSAVINQDGTISQWSVTASTLPLVTTRATAHCVVTNNRVYLFTFSGSTVTARYSDIGEDGVFGEWISSPAASFTASYRPVRSIVANDRVYLFDGREKAYSSPIDDSGFITGFSLDSTLGAFTFIGYAFATSSKIYAFYADYRYTAPFTGGYNDYLDKSYSISYDIIEPVLCDGDFNLPQVEIDGFSTFPAYCWGDIGSLLPEFAADAEPGVPTRYDIINGSPWTLQYQFNRSIQSHISGWSAGPALPGTLAYSAAVVFGGKVIMLGGVADGFLSGAVTSADILASGAPGSWSVQPTSLPSGRYAACVALTRDRIYLMGGSVNGSTSTPTCITAPISLSGEIGAWAAASSLPGSGTMRASVIVTVNRIYIIGGTTASAAISTVYTAPIGSDGVIGEWATHQYPLPIALKDSAIFKTDRYVYLIGGIDSTDTSTFSVCRAEFGDDGELGDWTYFQNGLSMAMCECTAVTTRNRVFVLGNDNILFTAPINSDGTIGSWSGFLNVPSGTVCHQLAVTHSKILIIGGWDADTTYHTPFTGGYDDYLCLGSEPIWVPTTLAYGSITLPLFSLSGQYLTNIFILGHITPPMVRFDFQAGVIYDQLFSTPMVEVSGSAVCTALGDGHIRAPRVSISGDVGADGRYWLPVQGLAGTADAAIQGAGAWDLPAIRVQSVANMNPEDNPVHGAGDFAIPGVGLSGDGSFLAAVNGDYLLPRPSVHGMAVLSPVGQGHVALPMVRLFGLSISSTSDQTLAFDHDEVITASGQPAAFADEVLAFDYYGQFTLPSAPPPASGQDPILKFER